MSTPKAIKAFVAAAGAAALLAACSDDNLNKGGPSPGVLRAEILGPASIAPGQTANYSVVEHLAGGGSRVLPTAAWASSNSGLVQISNSGVATARNVTGETVISVRTSVSAAKEVFVLPAGTFRLIGRVGDADVANLPIPGARVEVPDGPSATTDNTGLFRLYGVPGDGEIRISRDGYLTKTERVQLSANGTRNFTISLDGSIGNLSGNYTLTVEAAANCPNTTRPLAQDLRRRSYEASIRQNGSRLEVFVNDPRMVGNQFSGNVTPTGATFTVDWGYYDIYSQLAERMEDGAYLSIWGNAFTTNSSGNLSGTFNGGFEHFMYPPWSPRGSCSAASFSLTRR
jgi:hypothetical protein